MQTPNDESPPLPTPAGELTVITKAYDLVRELTRRVAKFPGRKAEYPTGVLRLVAHPGERRRTPRFSVSFSLWSDAVGQCESSSYLAGVFLSCGLATSKLAQANEKSTRAAVGRASQPVAGTRSEDGLGRPSYGKSVRKFPSRRPKHPGLHNFRTDASGSERIREVRR